LGRFADELRDLGKRRGDRGELDEFAFLELIDNLEQGRYFRAPAAVRQRVSNDDPPPKSLLSTVEGPLRSRQLATG
jgi:hypothetical protein